MRALSVGIFFPRVFCFQTSENEPLADAFEIEGYPAIKIFRNGDPKEYRGDREADAIVSAMRDEASPALILVDGE